MLTGARSAGGGCGSRWRGHEHEDRAGGAGTRACGATSAGSGATSAGTVLTPSTGTSDLPATPRLTAGGGGVTGATAGTGDTEAEAENGGIEATVGTGKEVIAVIVRKEDTTTAIAGIEEGIATVTVRREGTTVVTVENDITALAGSGNITDPTAEASSDTIESFINQSNLSQPQTDYQVKSKHMCLSPENFTITMKSAMC